MFIVAWTHDVDGYQRWKVVANYFEVEELLRKLKESGVTESQIRIGTLC